MERLTISVSDQFATELNEFMALRGYSNRSEAVRDLARMGMEQVHLQKQHGTDALAVLSYVFNQHTRELAKRLTTMHHDHHQLQVATMHVHLDHEHCLEIAVLRGPMATVQRFADGIMAERGVWHGHVALVPVSISSAAHAHGKETPASHHGHINPLG
jgi:CopG family nickel-responsive transcriptional regulator